jgi:hypothetical protein
MNLEAWSSLSPDGWWVAEGQTLFPAEGGEQYYTGLKLGKLDGSVEWSVVDEWSALGLGYTVPQAVRWSADGSYFYYTNRPVPDGCAMFVNGSDLQRVDLTDGSVIEVAPSVGLVLSLSPDETMLAYVGYGDKGLVLRDLASGEERPTQLARTDNAAAGSIVWSPDGAALMLTVATNYCGPADQRMHSIVQIEVATGEPKTLIEDDAHLFTTVEWSQEGAVWLVDGEGQYWRLDPITGEVTQFYPPEALLTKTLPELELQIRVPVGYDVIKNNEPNRRGSFVSFDFVRTGESETPYLYEIQFFSEASIRDFTMNCQEPCFFGDYPDLERYRGQKAAFETSSNYQHYRLGRFGDRHYFVSHHSCVGDRCVIREYTTFLGDTKVDVWVLMDDVSQLLQSDILFSAFEIAQ